MQIKSTSDIFLIFSVFAAVLAFLSWALPITLWLASSQWLLVSIAIGIWGLYPQFKYGSKK